MMGNTAILKHKQKLSGKGEFGETGSFISISEPRTTDTTLATEIRSTTLCCASHGDILVIYRFEVH